MKARLASALLIPAFLLALFSVQGCAEDNGLQPGFANTDDEALLQSLLGEIQSMPLSIVNDTIANGLSHMREEEKLARDVYQFFGEKYGTRIFSNIAQSEARHMAAMKVLLDRYGVPDPITSDARGSFTDPKFTALYAQLTGAGSASLLDALVVGATIEDLDIYDFEELSKVITAPDILLVHANLTAASKNHLRAFHAQILANQGSYTPQYISQSEFDLIVSTTNGGSRGGSNGGSKGRGWRGGR